MQIRVNAASPFARKVRIVVRETGLADGTALYDSRVICEYLDTLAGTTLFPRSGPERWRAVCQQALCDGILDAAVMTRYEVAVRPEPLRWSKWIDGQRSKIEGGLAALAKAQPQFGADFDIGQIGAACVLGYLDFRFPEMDWRSRYPGLTTWFEGASKRASVRDTFPLA